MISFILAATTSGPLILNRHDDRGVANELLQTGQHEQKNIDLLIQSCYDREISVIIDGGANVGTFSVQLAKAFPGATVHSFEPQRHMFWALCGNLALNNCFNAEPHNAGLAQVSAVAECPILDPRVPNGFSTVSLVNLPGGNIERRLVNTSAIDDLDLPRLDILKLDIEGMETRALRGAEATIRRHRPVIFVETWWREEANSQSDVILRLLPNYKETRMDDGRNSLFMPD